MNNFMAICLIILTILCAVGFITTCIMDYNEEVDIDKDYPPNR